MNVRGIIKDSLKYPFSDWKKILILGIILIVTDIVNISMNFGENVYLLILLMGIAFVVGFLVNGYIYRIIKSSLDGKVELPEFNNWVDMGVEGAKVYIVYIVYIIPTILLIIYFLMIYLSSYGAIFNLEISTFDFIPAFNSVFWSGIGNFISLNSLFGIASSGHFYAPIGILYLIIITPILLVAIANMAFYEGDLKSAFKVREIIEEISLIGWGNLIKWYILTGIIFIIFTNITFIVIYLFNMINLHLLGVIISALIIYPYFSIFLARSVALFYMPDEED